MNFLKAILHAGIGYGIRRKAWPPKAILSLDNFGELHWIDAVEEESRCRLLTGDLSWDLSPEDIQANDWETV